MQVQRKRKKISPIIHSVILFIRLSWRKSRLRIRTLNPSGLLIHYVHFTILWRRTWGNFILLFIAVWNRSYICNISIVFNLVFHHIMRHVFLHNIFSWKIPFNRWVVACVFLLMNRDSRLVVWMIHHIWRSVGYLFAMLINRRNQRRHVMSALMIQYVVLA